MHMQPRSCMVPIFTLFYANVPPSCLLTFYPPLKQSLLSVRQRLSFPYIVSPNDPGFRNQSQVK